MKFHLIVTFGFNTPFPSTTFRGGYYFREGAGVAIRKVKACTCYGLIRNYKIILFEIWKNIQRNHYPVIVFCFLSAYIMLTCKRLLLLL